MHWAASDAARIAHLQVQPPIDGVRSDELVSEPLHLLLWTVHLDKERFAVHTVHQSIRNKVDMKPRALALHAARVTCQATDHATSM